MCALIADHRVDIERARRLMSASASPRHVARPAAPPSGGRAKPRCGRPQNSTPDLTSRRAHRRSGVTGGAPGRRAGVAGPEPHHQQAAIDGDNRGSGRTDRIGRRGCGRHDDPPRARRYGCAAVSPKRCTARGANFATSCRWNASGKRRLCRPAAATPEQSTVSVRRASPPTCFPTAGSPA